MTTLRIEDISISTCRAPHSNQFQARIITSFRRREREVTMTFTADTRAKARGAAMRWLNTPDGLSPRERRAKSVMLPSQWAKRRAAEGLPL